MSFPLYSDLLNLQKSGFNIVMYLYEYILSFYYNINKNILTIKEVG